MAWTEYELEVLRDTQEELSAAHDSLYEYGKTIESVTLQGHAPGTTVVVSVHESHPPIDVRWSKSYAIWDGSWSSGSGTPVRGSIAAAIATDIEESMFRHDEGGGHHLEQAPAVPDTVEGPDAEQRDA